MSQFPDVAQYPDRTLREPGEQHEQIEQSERIVCGVAGGLLALYGLKRMDAAGVMLMVAGGALAARGITGEKSVGKMFTSLGNSLGGALGLPGVEGGQMQAKVSTVDRSVTIFKPREALYEFWHGFERLPEIFEHLEEVQTIDENVTQWTTKAIGGVTATWRAITTVDRPGEYIAWESIEPSDVPNRGYVRFVDHPAGRGTIVHVHMDYRTPGGMLGEAAAAITGNAPDRQVRSALHRFKQVMETGEMPTIEGQSGGRQSGGRMRDRMTDPTGSQQE